MDAFKSRCQLVFKIAQYMIMILCVLHSALSRFREHLCVLQYAVFKTRLLLWVPSHTVTVAPDFL